MTCTKELNQRKPDVHLNKQRNPREEHVGLNEKRMVPEGLRTFLDWDAELTNQLTNLMQIKVPNLTKSETKFMEVYQFL